MNILYEVAYQLSSFHEPSNLMQLWCLRRTFSAFCRLVNDPVCEERCRLEEGQRLSPTQSGIMTLEEVTRGVAMGSPWPGRRALHHQITPYQEGLFHKNQQEPRPSNGTAFCLSYGWDYTHTDCSIWRRGFGRKMPAGNPAIAGYQLHGNCFSNAAQYISPLSTEKARVAAPPVKVLHLPNWFGLTTHAPCATWPLIWIKITPTGQPFSIKQQDKGEVVNYLSEFNR